MAGMLTGYGSGYGSGYGDGYGDGYGSGSGYELPDRIAGFVAFVQRTFAVLLIGCEVHTVAHWRNNYIEIAERNGVTITAALRRQLMAALDLAELPELAGEGS